MSIPHLKSLINKFGLIGPNTALGLFFGRALMVWIKIGSISFHSSKSNSVSAGLNLKPSIR